MLDAEKRCWSKRVIDALSLPEGIFCDIVPTGSAAGTLSDEICEELSIQPCAVTAVAGHDTQCAMVAVPTEKMISSSSAAARGHCSEQSS